MNDRHNALGAFLRAHRERLVPADHGLPDDDRRRVPGLRREEVAQLAGISQYYYMRLEQGRDRNPSISVLDALARVLRLDQPARAYLGRLTEPDGPAARRDHVPVPETVRPELAELVNLWDTLPAMVLGRYRDVLAANPMAGALNPNFVPGRNLMREVFLDPGAPDRYPDWDVVAEEGVAALRASVGAEVRDPWRDGLVDDLAAGSEVFRRLWARQEAREKPVGRQRYRVPHLGVLDLLYEPFAVSYADRQLLYVFFASAGSETARLLDELSRRVTSAESPAHRRPS